MKKIKLKNLLKKTLKEQTTPYTGDYLSSTTPPYRGEPDTRYSCYTIEKPGHIRGLEVGDQTCIESSTGEFSTLDECRDACGGPDDVSVHTPFSCWNIEPWLSQNNIPGSENIDITLDFFCQNLCTQYDFEQQFPIMCGCCEKETCYKCEIDGINVIEESFYVYGLTSTQTGSTISGFFGCPPDWYENEEDACPNIDLIGTDNEDDEEDDGIDGNGIEFDDSTVVQDAGVDNEDEDDDIDDIDQLDPEKEGDEKIQCFQCTENNQVITDTFWGFCDQDEGWYDTPEEACGRGRTCYGCGINKGLTALDQFISEPFSQNELDEGDCPNAFTSDFDGWYNTPEETQCDPNAPEDLVIQNEYTCVWCPPKPPQGLIGYKPGYYYLQSPSEGGTHGWNMWDPWSDNDLEFWDESNWGEVGYADIGLGAPLPVPQDDDGKGVQQGEADTAGGNQIGLTGPECSSFSTINNPGAERYPELQQFCLDLGYPDLPTEYNEEGFENESDWTIDDIVNEDKPYSGEINCLYCPGVDEFWPDSMLADPSTNTPIYTDGSPLDWPFSTGNQGWWDEPWNPTVSGWRHWVQGQSGNNYYASGTYTPTGGPNYGWSWDTDYNNQVVPVVNAMSYGYWFLESWNNPGQGWDIDIDGPYPEGIDLGWNAFKGIDLSNCSYLMNTSNGFIENNPFVVVDYYNPDALANLPSWTWDYINTYTTSNSSMDDYCNARGYNEISAGNQLGYTEEDWTGIPTIEEGDCPWPKACNYGDPCPDGVDCVDNCYWGCPQAQEYFGLFVGMWGFGPCAGEIAAGWTDAICCTGCTSGCVGIVDQFNQNWNTIIIEDVMGDQYDTLCNTQETIADAMGYTQAYLDYLNQAINYAQQGVTFIPGVSSNPTTGEIFDTVEEYQAYANEYASYMQDAQSSDVFSTWGQICDGNFAITDFMASFLPAAGPTTLADAGINIDVELPDLNIFGINLGQEAEDFLQGMVDDFSINLGPQAIWSYIEQGINWVDCNYFNQWLELPAQTGNMAPCCDSELWGFCLGSNPISAWVNYMIDVGIDPNVLTYTDAVQGNYLENQSLYPPMGTSIATWQNNLFGDTFGNAYSGGSWGPYSSVGDGGWCLNGGAPSSVSGNIYESKLSNKSKLLKERLQKLAGIKKSK